MGAGRKTETNPPVPPTRHQTNRSNTRPERNSQVSIRHLDPDKLGGVIFGCTHETIKECLSKQLFGLTERHWVYVKNVKPGLPLFLFNYTGRKMHGIFEATTSGQFAMDQFAWSGDSRTRTQFPAQVRVSTKTECPPLPENKYKNAISGSYYTNTYFYFELDHAQTEALISLFMTAQPAPARAIPHKQDRSGRTALAIQRKRDCSSRHDPAHVISDNQRFSGPSGPAAVSNKWNPSGSSSSRTVKLQPIPCEVKTEFDSKDSNQFGVSLHSRDIVPYNLADRDADFPTSSRSSKSNLGEQAPDWDDLDNGLTKEGTESVCDDLQHSPVHDEHHDTTTICHKFQLLSVSQQEVNFSSDKSSIQEAQPGAAFPKYPFNATSDSNAPEKDNTSFDQRRINDEMHQIVDELYKKTEALVKKQTVSDQEILLLKESVKNTERRVQQVEDQFDKLQSKYNSLATLLVRTQNDGEGPSIFLIGGHDGNAWLSSLVSFRPTTDRLEPLKPMSSDRGCAAVAALKDHFFVFGGWNGSSWYNTVECYSRGNNEWITCPCLKREKGSLAGATLNNKIFAIGGGDGLQYFSEIEVFDPELGSWVHGPSMRKCRFVPAAAELNGILYVVGGFDGDKYLRSTERYDPREGFWTQLPSMETRRASHSVAVLGEALYALGGHNGDHMISTVEVFDPHANSWRISTPLSVPRGYGCTFTVKDNIYFVGGVQLGGECVETVEVYNEKEGWSSPGYKAIGKRSFASAIVI